MILKIGNIVNTERKFVPIRTSKFNSYLEQLVFLEKYEIEQFYYEGKKYRKFIDDSDIKFTKSMKMNNITKVEEITKEEYESKNIDNHFIRKFREKYQDGEFQIEVDRFFYPIKMIIVEVSSETQELDEYQVPATFIEVTGNALYDNAEIINKSIKLSNVILEGTDGVGKTATIIGLLKYGIVCTDRSEDVISKNMLFDVPMEKRCSIYNEYLERNDVKVVFLINSDKEELLRRVNSREKISEFDLETYEYNKLYEETFYNMQSKYNIEDKLLLVDCTGLSLEEQINKIKEVVLNENSINNRV